MKKCIDRVVAELDNWCSVVVMDGRKHADAIALLPWGRELDVVQLVAQLLLQGVAIERGELGGFAALGLALGNHLVAEVGPRW